MAFMGGRFRFKRKISIGRVVGKLTATLISLWVGGTILTALGNVMNGQCSAFFNGLTLIGWTVNQTTGCITAVDTGSGVLVVIGLVGIASIVLEFVQFKL